MFEYRKVCSNRNQALVSGLGRVTWPEAPSRPPPAELASVNFQKRSEFHMVAMATRMLP